MNVNKLISSIRYDKVKDSYRGRLVVEGKCKSFYASTKREVREKFKAFLDHALIAPVPGQSVCLDKYIEYWLKTYKLYKIEPSSYSRLVSIYESRVKTQLGKLSLTNVTTSHVQELIDEYANPSRGSSPLARSGLKKVKSLLNACFSCAVKEGLIKKNPCDDVLIPVESCVLVKTKEQFALSEMELVKFRETCLERNSYNNEYMSRNAIVLLILVNLGLRIGEMVALKWDDIDIHQRLIHVNKIVQVNLRTETGINMSGSMRLKTSSKTKSGVRVLPLSQSVLEYLEILKLYDERNQIRSEYVACTMHSKMSSPHNFTRSLESVKKRAKLNDKITLHTLRHTFGSSLIRKGVSIEVVSKLLGHSAITVTYNTYIHVLQEEAAKAMNNISIC